MSDFWDEVARSGLFDSQFIAKMQGRFAEDHVTSPALLAYYEESDLTELGVSNGAVRRALLRLMRG